MFAPKAARSLTKAATNSTNKLAARHSALATRPFGGTAEQALTGGIGNQSTLRLLAQRASRSTGNEAGSDHEQAIAPKNMTALDAPHGLSWNFGKIPIYPPGQTAQRETPFSATASVQKDPAQGGTPVTSAGELPEIVHEVLRSPGQPLDTAMKVSFESSFHQVLPDVRIHSGTLAMDSARVINARAWSFGRDVVFGKHEYAPHTEAGRRLLTHELIHVTQQPQIDGAPRGVAGPEVPAERQARSGIVGHQGGLAAPGLLHRQETAPVATPAPAGQTPPQTAPVTQEAAPIPQTASDAPPAKQDAASAEADQEGAVRAEVREWLDRMRFGVPLVLDSGTKPPEEWHAVYGEQRWTLTKITDDTFDVLAQRRRVYSKPEIKRSDVWQQVYQYYQQKEHENSAESWQIVIQSMYTPSYSLASTSPISGSRLQNPLQLTLGGTLAEHPQGTPGLEHQFAVTGSFFNLGSGNVDWFQNALAQYQLSLVSPIGRDFQIGGSWASAQSSIYAQLGAGVGANWDTTPGGERKAYVGFLLQPGIGGQLAVSIGWFQLIVNGTVVFSAFSPTAQTGSRWTGTLGAQGGLGFGGQF
jgi:hypothetical protein